MQEVKKAVIGHFKSTDSGPMLVFRKVAISLRDDCPFHAVVEYVKLTALYNCIVSYCIQGES